MDQASRSWKQKIWRLGDQNKAINFCGLDSSGLKQFSSGRRRHVAGKLVVSRNMPRENTCFLEDTHRGPLWKHFLEVISSF
jgi:hypothetical protein